MEIARPFAHDMKLLKPSLTREFIQYVPFKVSFTLTVIVFIVSTVLHLVFMYVYHRFILQIESFQNHPLKKNDIKPVLQVTNECPPALSTKLSKHYFLISPIAKNSSEETREILTLDPNQQAASSSSSAASEPPYGNNSKYTMTKTAPPKENIYMWLCPKKLLRHLPDPTV